MSKAELGCSSRRERTVVITGTGGLGLQAGIALARAGARVIVAGRNTEKGSQATAAMARAAPNATVDFELLDLASLCSVRDFAARFERRYSSLEVLINNAGIMSPPTRHTTVDGFELQFGVNYLAHFALTGLLLPSLLRASSPRVVNVTSLAHRYARIDFEDLQSARSYRAGVAYCQSKLAQALFAVELQRRSEASHSRLTSNAAHPGYAGTSLFQNTAGAVSLLNIVSKFIVIPVIGQSAKRGALPIVYAACDSQAVGGALYGPTGPFEMRGAAGRREFASGALDPSVAARLWAVSEELCGVQLQFGA